MKQKTITISIGGGYALDRATLFALLSRIPDLQVVPIEEAAPHILLWDASNDQLENLPPPQPGIAILLLLEEVNFQTIPEKVRGLFSKDESTEALVSAIRQVARGEQYLSPSLALAYLKSKQSRGRKLQDSALETLSEREKEILDLLAQGQSNKSIASRLYLSVRTVEGHLASIYAKLGVHSRTEAMLVAIESR